MTIAGSGSISWNDVVIEVGLASGSSLAFNDTRVYTLTGKSAGSTIVFPTDFYGKTYPSAADYTIAYSGMSSGDVGNGAAVNLYPGDISGINQTCTLSIQTSSWSNMLAFTMYRTRGGSTVGVASHGSPTTTTFTVQNGDQLSFEAIANDTDIFNDNSYSGFLTFTLRNQSDGNALLEQTEVYASYTGSA